MSIILGLAKFICIEDPFAGYVLFLFHSVDKVKRFFVVCAGRTFYQSYTRSPWRPKFASQVNHKAVTSAVIDSRDFFAAKRKASTDVLVPAGPKVLFTGGHDFEDYILIWAKLDKILAFHPDMVLVHGGSPKGAELIADKWAVARKVTAVAFKPDWNKQGKAAPFKRNNQMLELLPIGVILTPGSGIQENIADKAIGKGVRVLRIGGGNTG